MQHVDPELLALLALGERDAVTGADSEHVESCPECSSEVRALADVVETGRDAGDDLVAPPDRVWERVRAEISSEASADDRRVPDAPVVDLAGRRRAPAAWFAAAAGVALVAGVAGGVWWERSRDGSSAEPSVVTLASADLEALPDWGGSHGSAIVEQLPDGERRVVVQVAEAGPVEDAYQEVWLLAEDLSGMVSLGVLEGTEGTFPVPDGVDLARYAVVDVSAEPLDGDPTHSGDSILRGGLTEA